MISFHEARNKILEGIKPLPPEKCRLEDFLGRILVQDVAASFDIPQKDNSAMDGFAIIAADVANASQDDPVTLQVIEDVPAGKVATKSLKPGQAIRIMTGAQIPEGADAVVPVELTSKGIQNIEVRILKAVRQGANIRRQGEDVKSGQMLITKGTRLRPQEVGLIASLGLMEVLVTKQPVVGIISSGNEIAAPGQTLKPGQIYDANRFSIAGQVKEAGAVAKDYGIVPDDLSAIKGILNKAAQDCDVIITSGGVSVGDYDLMKQVLSELGQMNFWQVKQKPGKPLAFGHINGKPVVGLPGNPVSSMVVCDQYVRPLMLKMQGCAAIFKTAITAVCDQAIKKPAGKTQFLRAKVKWQDGAYHTVLTGPQGSGILTSMVQADGLMILPEECDGVKQGDMVSVELFG
ncbi:MAG: molybdopterin molybdotransferase MoeA [Candidatus Edwardsbacteria bacterium]|nr:molybdopterin molybdotransferase MoeA [Candidatus Edwardsbacteria bacterium]MBU1576365.1 molybdopterin molybdotransferase MoeA [Candidatus Edwardsbacteria bacterium]MBU2463207.1 molybdopterin molybdotransferase MoeA [Candidatus Edwardsbacteria bacterium]MBU2593542.1 molybdopterin molybdotransferase MoeA [Candidatus Edwardsbacteria bacterium]